MEGIRRLLVDAGLGVDEVAGVHARALDRGLRLEAVVEDGRGDADERGAEARSAGRADRKLERSPTRASVGAIMLPCARRGGAHDRGVVGLAEHRVQVEIETGRQSPELSPLRLA